MSDPLFIVVDHTSSGCDRYIAGWRTVAPIMVADRLQAKKSTAEQAKADLDRLKELHKSVPFTAEIIPA